MSASRKTVTMGMLCIVMVGTQLLYYNLARTLFRVYRTHSPSSDEQDVQPLLKKMLHLDHPTSAPANGKSIIELMETLWAESIQHRPTSSSLTKHPQYTMLLYFANCIPASVSEAGKDPLETNTVPKCFIADREKQQRSYEEIKAFIKEEICSVPGDMLKLIRLSNCRSVSVASIGMTLKHLHTLSNSSARVDNAVFAEIDARVSEYVYQHERICLTSDEMASNRMSEVSKRFSSHQIKSMEMFNFLLSYMRFTLYGTTITGYLKLIDPKPIRYQPIFLNQGVAELVAHQVDRLLGLYLTPDSNFRRLKVIGHCSIPGLKPKLNCSGGDFIPDELDGIAFTSGHRVKESVPTIMISLLPYITFDEVYGWHYIDTVMIGAVKSMEQDIEINPTYNPVLNYFHHNTSMDALEAIGFTRQTLRDISDIILLDFIVQNPDRGNKKNWVMSETRLMAFDNGLAFWYTLKDTCIILLDKPSIFAHLDGWYHDSKCKKTIDDISNVEFCRFNVKTFDKLRYAAVNGFGSYIEKWLNTMPWYSHNYGAYFGVNNITHALDMRISDVISYINKCKLKYGDSNIWI